MLSQFGWPPTKGTSRMPNRRESVGIRPEQVGWHELDAVFGNASSIACSRSSVVMRSGLRFTLSGSQECASGMR